MKETYRILSRRHHVGSRQPRYRTGQLRHIWRHLSTYTARLGIHKTQLGNIERMTTRSHAKAKC